MLLTQKELEELTGANTPVKQKNVLKQHGIGFVNRADGAVAVTWPVVNAALIGKRKGSQQGDSEPDFSMFEA